MKGRLSEREPPPGSSRRAAVAVIYRKSDDSILLIERAKAQGDPWSGQIAFPGGKMQSEDKTLRDVATREAAEEVGLRLQYAEFLGYFSPFMTHTGNIEVVPAIFLLDGDPAIIPNAEVASVRWIPLGELRGSGGASWDFERGGERIRTPAYAIGGYTVWGLTYRIITELLGMQT